MSVKTTLLLALGLFGCAGTMTATAEPLGALPTRPAPGQAGVDVFAMLRSMGLTPVAAPVRTGAHRYVVHAVDEYGRLMRVAVHAHSHRVAVKVQPVKHVSRSDHFAPPSDRMQPPGFVPPRPGYARPYDWRDRAWDEDDDDDDNDDVSQRLDIPRRGEAPPIRSHREARLSPPQEIGPRVIYADPGHFRQPLPGKSSALRHAAPAAKPPLPRPRPAAGEQAALQPGATAPPKPAAAASSSADEAVPPLSLRPRAEERRVEPQAKAETAPAPQATSDGHSEGANYPPVQPPF